MKFGLSTSVPPANLGQESSLRPAYPRLLCHLPLSHLGGVWVTREKDRDHIHMAFIAVHRYHCSTALLVTVDDIELCLLYNLVFIGVCLQGKNVVHLRPGTLWFQHARRYWDVSPRVKGRRCAFSEVLGQGKQYIDVKHRLTWSLNSVLNHMPTSSMSKRVCESEETHWNGNDSTLSLPWKKREIRTTWSWKPLLQWGIKGGIKKWFILLPLTVLVTTAQRCQEFVEIPALTSVCWGTGLGNGTG